MKPVITDINGIGPAAAEALAEHHIRTVASLARASVEKVNAVPGFSEARAIRVIAAASELLAESATTSEPATAGKPAKAGGKDKKDKKGKRKDKGKGKKGKKGKDKKGKKGKGKKKGKK